MKSRPLSLWVSLAALLALVLFLGTADSARADGTFDPAYRLELVNPEAGANSDTKTEFDLPKGDLQFGGLVLFIPNEFEITPADEIPIGTIVGDLVSDATLGIINGACNNVITVEFVMLNASIDVTDTVPFIDTDPEAGEEGYDPHHPGNDVEDFAQDIEGYGTPDAATANTLTDDGNPFPPGEFEGFTITVWETAGTGERQTRMIVSNTADTVTVEPDWDTVPDDTWRYHIKSGLQDSIEKYPDFITRVLDDELGDGGPLQPIRRSAGITVVAGANVLLQFLVFEPGTFIDELIPYDEELGYPTVTLLQNAGDPDFDPVPGPITDFCTALISSNITFGVSKDNPCTDDLPVDQLDPICEVQSAFLAEGGTPTDPDESGIVLGALPGEGTYTFTAIAAAQRDADGDGIENSLDSCAFEPNVGDPRVGGDGDFDEDGLDAACDPNDDETNSDEDLDGYINRQDNCPLEPNGEDQDNQRDTDDDAIGDACDPNPDDEDAQGEVIIVERTADVTIGPAGAADQDETPTADETPAADETPTADETPEPTADGEGSEDDDGGGGGVIVIVIVVIAAVVVIGGGAFLLMRRRGA